MKGNKLIKKTRVKLYLCVLIIVGIISLGAGIYFLFMQQMDLENPITTEKVILGVETSFLTAPVWIAENKGYFQKENLEVKIKEFNSGKASINAMLNSKNIDICTVAQTPIMFHSFTRSDFSIIAAMVHSDNDVKVLFRQDEGIENPLDLRGKKIGITEGTTGEFFLDFFLIHKGLLSHEVETVDLNPSELPQALSDGHVDAICTWEPHIINARKMLGKKVLILPSGGIYREDFYFVANRSFVESSPEILKRFLKAIEKGEEFIQKDQEGAINIVSERLKLDKELTVLVWDEFNFRLVLDQSIIISLEDEARWAIKEELVDKEEVPDYLDFIYIDALEEVKPEAVTIIR